MTPDLEFVSELAEQRLALRCEQAREAGRAARCRPRLARHADQVAPALKGRAIQQDFEVLISAVIFDRNSQVGLHKLRKNQPLAKVNRARARARSLSQTYCSA